MNPDDHKDYSMWCGFLHADVVWMSNHVLRQIAKDVRIEMIARKLEPLKDEPDVIDHERGRI